MRHDQVPSLRQHSRGVFLLGSFIIFKTEKKLLKELTEAFKKHPELSARSKQIKQRHIEKERLAPCFDSTAGATSHGSCQSKAALPIDKGIFKSVSCAKLDKTSPD